jgi:hypothetical protein
MLSLPKSIYFISHFSASAESYKKQTEADLKVQPLKDLKIIESYFN